MINTCAGTATAPYHDPVHSRSTMSPKLKFAFLATWTGFVGVSSVLMAVFLAGDLEGGDATATVVHVYSHKDYTVTFTTKDGVHCESLYKWDYRREQVRVGDNFEVRYSKISPCDNVNRADDFFSRFGGYFIPPIMFAGGLTALVRSRRKTTAEARTLTPTTTAQ